MSDEQKEAFARHYAAFLAGAGEYPSGLQRLVGAPEATRIAYAVKVGFDAGMAKEYNNSH